MWEVSTSGVKSCVGCVDSRVTPTDQMPLQTPNRSYVAWNPLKFEPALYADANGRQESSDSQIPPSDEDARRLQVSDTTRACNELVLDPTSSIAPDYSISTTVSGSAQVQVGAFSLPGDKCAQVSMHGDMCGLRCTRIFVCSLGRNSIWVCN